MNVAAYLRQTPTGSALSDQLRILEQRARDREWSITFHAEDLGGDKAGDLKKNWYFQHFLGTVIHGSPVRVQGVMFWHAGHVAGSLAGFLRLTQWLADREIDWYVENPKLESREESSRLIVSLSRDLLGLHEEINGLNLRERNAAMAARRANPGRKKISPQMETDIRLLKLDGQSNRDIADVMKVSLATVSRVLKEIPVVPTG
jgi:DNA invertase Pin-like site-specific DNA recombinase